MIRNKGIKVKNTSTILNNVENIVEKIEMTNKVFHIYNKEKCLDRLKKGQYMVYFNTNSPLYLLYFCKVKFKNSLVNCSFLIDRSKNPEIYLYNVNLDLGLDLGLDLNLDLNINEDNGDNGDNGDNEKTIFDGTVVEGEILEDIFYISDIYSYKGEDVGKYFLLDKIKLIQRIVDVICPGSDLVVDMKHFCLLTQLDNFVEEWTDIVPYNDDIRGIIFRNIDPKTREHIIFNFNKKPNKYVNNSYNNNGSHNNNGNNGNNCNNNNRNAYNNNNNNFENNANGLNRMDCENNVNKIAVKVDLQGHDPDFCFWMSKTDKTDVYNLRPYLTNSKKMDLALVNDLNTSLFLQDCLNNFTKEKAEKGILVKCNYDSNFEKWKPIVILDKCTKDLFN